MAIRLVAGPLKCSLGRRRSIDANDNAVRASTTRGPTHDDNRTRAVPDKVAGCAPQPEGSGTLMTARPDNDQVARVDVVDQGQRGGTR